MKKFAIAVYSVFIFLLAGCYFSKDINSVTRSIDTSRVSETLSKLNSWDSEELNVFECHTDSDLVASSQTGGWIVAHKRELKDLGIYVRWNCEDKIYEIVGEENAPPECSC